jgi:hypothetical protein
MHYAKLAFPYPHQNVQMHGKTDKVPALKQRMSAATIVLDVTLMQLLLHFFFLFNGLPFHPPSSVEFLSRGPCILY